jgi:GTP-binding protein
MADIPGLIEGAAEGAGIGDRFLGHIERTRVLLHLIPADAEDAVEAWRIVRGEIEEYGAGLADKPEIVALSKADLLGDKERAKLVTKLQKATGATVFPISAPLTEGVEGLLDSIVETLGQTAQPERDEAAAERSWSPL